MKSFPTPSKVISIILLLMFSNCLLASSLRLTSSLGIGSGELRWSIADPSGDPDVLSELIYDAERLYIANIDARITVPNGELKNLVLGAWVDYNYISDGKSEDRDWNESGRNDLYSLSESEIYGKSLNAYELYFGYRFELSDTLTLIPRFGYHKSEQTFYVRNGVQLLSEPPQTSPLGPIDGLDSSYQTEWEGFKFGAELDLNLSGKFSMSFIADLFRLDYDAKANWNLRDDFAQPLSFRHQSESDRAYRIETQVRYQLDKRSGLSGWIRHESFETKAGTDTIFFDNGNIASTPLNEAVWESWALGFGYMHRF